MFIDKHPINKSSTPKESYSFAEYISINIRIRWIQKDLDQQVHAQAMTYIVLIPDNPGTKSETLKIQRCQSHRDCMFIDKHPINKSSAPKESYSFAEYISINIRIRWIQKDLDQQVHAKVMTDIVLIPNSGTKRELLKAQFVPFTEFQNATCR